MIPEEKIVQKIREVLIADTTTKGYVGVRVYEDHVSTIQQPEYPAISLFVLDSSVDFSNREFVRMSIQVDIWMSGSVYKSNDMNSVKERIRALVDRQNLTDTTIGLTVARVTEIPGSPLMRDPDTDLLHLPIRFSVVAK